MSDRESVLESGFKDAHPRVSYDSVFVMEIVNATMEVREIASAVDRLYRQAISQLPERAQLVGASSPVCLPIGTDQQGGTGRIIWFVSLTVNYYVKPERAEGIPAAINHLVDIAAAAGGRVAVEPAGDITALAQRILANTSGMRRVGPGEYLDAIRGAADEKAAGTVARPRDITIEPSAGVGPAGGSSVGQPDLGGAELLGPVGLPAAQGATSPQGQVTGAQGTNVDADNRPGRRFPEVRDLS